MNTLSPSHQDNLVRWQSTMKSGFYESHFIKVNIPDSDAAFWWKFTVLRPLEGPTVFEVWAIFFDVANPANSCAAKQSYHAEDAAVSRKDLRCHYGNSELAGLGQAW